MKDYHVALTGDYGHDSRFLRMLGYRGNYEELLDRMYETPHDLRRLTITPYQYRLYKDGKERGTFHKSITLSEIKEPKTFDIRVEEPERKKKKFDYDTINDFLEYTRDTRTVNF